MYILHILKSKSRFNVKSSTCYFHMKMNILADFQICISVPLSETVGIASVLSTKI